MSKASFFFSAKPESVVVQLLAVWFPIITQGSTNWAEILAILRTDPDLRKMSAREIFARSPANAPGFTHPKPAGKGFGKECKRSLLFIDRHSRIVRVKAALQGRASVKIESPPNNSRLRFDDLTPLKQSIGDGWRVKRGVIHTKGDGEILQRNLSLSPLAIEEVLDRALREETVFLDLETDNHLGERCTIVVIRAQPQQAPRPIQAALKF